MQCEHGNPARLRHPESSLQGLGKTVQTIGFLCHLRNAGHILGPYMVGAAPQRAPWAPERHCLSASGMHGCKQHAAARQEEEGPGARGGATAASRRTARARPLLSTHTGRRACPALPGCLGWRLSAFGGLGVEASELVALQVPTLCRSPLPPRQVLGPLSTLTNWVSEFERWAPGFPVVLYHGSKQERQHIRSTRMPTGGRGRGLECGTRLRWADAGLQSRR